MASSLHDGSSAEAPAILERISLERGLPHSVVGAIHQDRRGFLWVGSWAGLSRYDGYGFKTYEHRAFDATTLSNPQVIGVQSEVSGLLWVGTRKGVDRLDPRTGVVRQYTPQPPPGAGAQVTAVLLSRSGTLWVGTEGAGLYSFDPSTEQWRHFAPQTGVLNHGLISDVRQGSRGRVWIATMGGGLHCYDPDTDQVHPVNIAALGERPSQRVLFTAYEDSNGQVWIGTVQDGLYRWHPPSGAVRVFRHDPEDAGSLGHDAVRTILGDTSGNIWIGTWGGGLDRLDPARVRFEHFRSEEGNPSTLSGEHVTSLWEDRSGILWIGTYGGGLSKLDLAPRPFRNYRHLPGDQRSLSGRIVQAIHQSRRDELWIGTSEGLDRLDLASGTFRHYRHNPDDPRSLSDSNVFAIQEDVTGRIWVGTLDGLNLYSPASDSFRRFCQDHRSDGACMRSRSILALADGPDRSLWIGANEGLERLDTRTERFEFLDSGPACQGGRSFERVTSLAIASDGLVWYGTDAAGLKSYDPSTGAFACYPHRPDDVDSPSHDHVTALHIDPEGALWIGTYGGGLDRLEVSSGHFEHLTEEDGLPDSIIYGIASDRRDRLWVSTSAGLASLDTKSRVVVETFDSADGLPTDEFTRGAAYEGLDGMLYFGSVAGLTAVDPERRWRDPHPPSIALTSIRRYSEKTWLEVALPDQGEALEIPHSERIFAVEFAALNFRSPERNRYAYRLDGLTDDWVELGTKRDLTFTLLAPGEYRLRIRGANKDGLWSGREATLSLSVLRPWWRLWWVWTTSAAVLGFAAWATRSRAVEGSRKRAVALEQEVKRRKLAQSEARQAQRTVLRLMGDAGEEGLVEGPPPWLRQVRAELDRSFVVPPTVGELALAAGVHPDHVSRSFRKRYGLRISDYVSKLRIEWSCGRLVNSEDSLAEIALAAGFSDQSHFSRTFKRLMGVTPTRYRNGQRAGVQ